MTSRFSAFVACITAALVVAQPASGQNTEDPSSFSFATPQDSLYDIYVAQACAPFAYAGLADPIFGDIYNEYLTVYFNVYFVKIYPDLYTTEDQIAILQAAADASLALCLKYLDSGYVDFNAVFNGLSAANPAVQGVNAQIGNSNYFAWCGMWFSYYAYLDLLTDIQSLQSVSPAP